MWRYLPNGWQKRMTRHRTVTHWDTSMSFMLSSVQKQSGAADQPHAARPGTARGEAGSDGMIVLCLQPICDTEQGTLMPDLRVLIVADDPLVRTGLALSLARPEQGESETALEHLVDLREAGQAVLVLLADPTDAVAVWTAGVRGLLLRNVDVAT